jgi:hypothetical protein
MSSRDELVMQLMSATDMDFGTAIASLESSNWNLQQCMNKLFDNGAATESNVRNSNGAGNGVGNGNDIDGDDVIRAPILPRTEVLSQVARVARPTASAASFNTNSFDIARQNQRDFRAEGRFGNASASNAKSAKLAELFRPPTDLLFVGTYDEAIERAKAKQLWLVVNVQDIHEFDSQRLNRDTWSDAGVRALIQASCVFLQLPYGTRAASEFLQLYPATTAGTDATVSIAVIDPRTGERVLRWQGFVSHEEFFVRLSDTIDRLPLDSYRKVASRAKEVRLPEVRRELTEEESIAAAIAASLESMPPTASNSTSTAAVSTTQIPKRKADQIVATERTAAATTTTTTTSTMTSMSNEAVPVHTPKRRTLAAAAEVVRVPLQSETEANACECVIMVRLLNGQRIKCGFAASATLADLHRYVAQHGFGEQGPPAEDFALTLQLPTRVYSGAQLEQVTMADAKLHGRALVLVTAIVPATP